VFRALLAHRAPQAGAGSASAVGAIAVQDPRLERLAELFRPRKTTPIEIRVHDLCPSLEREFSSAELEAMKRMDELLLVLGAFADPSSEAAVRELDRLVGELVFADLAQVERRLKAASREKLAETTREVLERVQAGLEAERPVYAMELSGPQREAIRGYAFVTDRPFAVLLNVGEAFVGRPPPEALAKRCAELGMPLRALCGSLEAEMAALPAAEREAFLASFGVAESAGAAVTRLVLERADVIPFFTVGEDECRAWPIARGTTARRAAGRVHSDIERGFIRAEVIAYDVLEPLGGDLGEARKRGLLRVEGKDYVVRDGEIVHFRFNV
jgi:hypothetical protein